MCPGVTTNKMIAEFAENIAKQHPTHQANIVRNLTLMLTTYGQQMVRVDERNKAAVDLCDKIKELDFYIPYI